MSEPLLKPEVAGEQVGLTVGALAQMRYTGTGPNFVRLTPRSIRYRQSDLDEWITASVRDRDSEAFKPQAS